MHKGVELLSNSVQNTRRAMADVHHSDAAGEIEKSISVHIFQYAAFGARCKNRSGVPTPRATAACRRRIHSCDLGPGIGVRN